MTLPEALKARLVALVVGVKAEAARLGAGTGLVTRSWRGWTHAGVLKLGSGSERRRQVV